MYNFFSRANEQKYDDIILLERGQQAHNRAIKAVEQGDNTLKEANNTYHTLIGNVYIAYVYKMYIRFKILITLKYFRLYVGFQFDVQKSSERAKDALKTIPLIENEIENAETLIRQAEEALAGANKNANEAKQNAQEAQQKYAEQASKVSQNIRIKYIILYIDSTIMLSLKLLTYTHIIRYIRIYVFILF